MIFHLIPLYFAQSGLSFLQFLVFKVIFYVCGQNFHKLFTPFVPFIVLIATASISRFQCKSCFKKQATLGWEVCKNLKACQIKPPANTSFFQISQPRLGCFSNTFLHWNCVFKTVVLSTIEGTNRVKKWWTSNITSKTRNCKKTRPEFNKILRFWKQCTVAGDICKTNKK